jgi:pimeloyl-ACP methyl ester carboxylesterase
VDKTISYRGGTLCYRDEGSGTPLLLVHGFAEDGAIWDKVASGLRSGCRLLIPDLPGSGRSSLLVEGTTIESLAAALKNLLDHEGIDRCVLIGHSMGGYIALAFAELFPERVLAFGFFHSTAYADSEEKKAGRQKSIAFIGQHGAAPFIRQSTPNLFAPATQVQKPALIEDMIHRYSSFSSESLCAYLEAMRQRPERLSVLERFAGPILFVIGEKDQVVPLEQSLRQCHLPRVSMVHILPTSGHMGMLEDTGSGSMIIQSFLNFIASL